MAPFKLILSSVLVLVSVHILVLEGSRTDRCPSACSCLGPLVDCSSKGLSLVPPDLPSWTQMLDLTHNEIATLDESSFAGLHALTELDLSHNRLGIINGSCFHNLPSLGRLALDHNHMVELPDIGDQPSLHTWSVQENAIHSLNRCIVENLPKLQILDLSLNHLVDLPADTFGNSSSLKHLSLSHNRLVGLERGVFDNLTALESLKLSKNRLSSLPKDLFRQLASLQHLELNSVELHTIEGLTFQGLSSLQVLKLRHAGIATLQDGAFYGLSGIKKLQLDFNHIGKVTKGWLYGLNSLQRLYVNNNNISEIEDDAWDSGKRIIELDMSHNKLSSVTPKTFDRLYALKRLILSKNLITYIEEESFRELGALQYLELNGNEVWWSVEEAGVFGGLRNLRYLGLGGIGLKSLGSRSLQGLSRLQQLNITHNPITTIEKGALPNLRELFMNTSSLLCDCQMVWLTKDFKYKVHAKCKFPERLKGMSVFQIHPSEMPCDESNVRAKLLKEPSSTRSTLKGENVTLECQAASTTPYVTSIFWRKDGRLLQHVETVRSFGGLLGNSTLVTSFLSIRNIQDEDEGKYQCVATNEFASAYSTKARIIVNVFPVFSKTPTDVSVKSGQTARLECGAKGQPRPVITWRKDDAREDFPAARDRRMHVMPSDDVFFIVNVRPQDSGLYSCYARNAAGTVSANATLTVLEFPSFTRHMEDKETRSGETTVLECLAGGSPKPRLMWLKGGEPLVPTERHFFTAGDQLLIIVQTQASDAGDYSCNVSNALGSELGHSRLKVLQGSGIILLGAEENGTTTGVIVIAVVICIVGTSIVWVVIIYHTRKHTVREDYAPPPATSYALPHRKPINEGSFLDSHSGVSKDSGTGDSGQQSGSELLLEDSILLGTTRHFSHVVGESSGSERSGSSVSKERVPLLHTFRGHWNVGREQRPSARLCVARYYVEGERQRSQSAEHLQVEGDERAALPRSLTLASVSQSPRLARLLPADVPNDSGSFSIASEEPTTQEQSHSISITGIVPAFSALYTGSMNATA